MKKMLFSDYTKILIIGGYVGGSTLSVIDDVEVLDLSDGTSQCVDVANIPARVEYVEGALLDGVPKVCGGYNADVGANTDVCYEYNSGQNTWSEVGPMTTARAGHAASVVGSNQWFVTGGIDDLGNILSTTEVWTDGAFGPGPDLTFPSYGHCQVTLNGTHIFIGGKYETDAAYLLNWAEDEWRRLPPLS